MVRVCSWFFLSCSFLKKEETSAVVGGFIQLLCKARVIKWGESGMCKSSKLLYDARVF